ncbi:MAG TPA: alpha/beta hydrolase [Cyclobacteriaceae bacterium]|jgi:pimeloyl-ACP methyl ester carboxylesterase|nr:alpha/beta hydrolase [Cyclobacteriaceae bacterium]
MSFKTILIVLCLCFSSLHAQNTSPKYGDNPAAGGFYNHDGVKVYYEIYGQGKPMVILHGNGGSIGGRANLIPDFASHYKVIALDNRCHGKSDCPKGYLTYEQMASDVNAVLNHLKIDSAYIWGHSDGGIIGLLVAIHYPKKVKKLLASGPNLRPDSTAVDPAVFPLMDKMWPMVKNDTIQSKQFRLLVEQPHIKIADVKKIKADVMIMGGDRDVIRNEHLLEMHKNIPRSLLCILPGTTHFVATDRQKWFMEILYDFFDNPQRRATTVELMMQQMK